MLKSNLSIFLLFASLLASCDLEKIEESNTPASQTFQKNFGCTDCLDKAYGITKTTDGNIVITGETAGFGSVKQDAFIWKFDRFGNPVWDLPKLFSFGQNDDAGYAVREASNQNLLMVGVCNKQGSSGGSTLLLETFPDGSKSNLRPFNDPQVGSGVGFYANESRDIVESNDGGLIYAGSLELCNPGCNHLWLGKTDRSGIDQYSDGWGNGINTFGTALTKNTSGYFAAGYQLIGSPANYDIYLGARKSDDFSVTTNIATKTLALPGNQYLNDILTTDAGSILGIGSDDLNANGASDVLFMEFSNNALDIISNKKVSEPDAEKAYSIIQTNDGNYVLTGEVTGTGSGNTDLLLMKISKNGDKIWKYNYGGAFKDVGYGLVELSDGSLMIVGYTQKSTMADSSDILLIRADKDGKVN